MKAAASVKVGDNPAADPEMNGMARSELSQIEEEDGKEKRLVKGYTFTLQVLTLNFDFLHGLNAKKTK